MTQKRPKGTAKYTNQSANCGNSQGNSLALYLRFFSARLSKLDYYIAFHKTSSQLAPHLL